MPPPDLQGHAATSERELIRFARSCRQVPVERPDNRSLFLTTALVAVRRKPMTYRELTMIDVREVLRRWSAGQSNRQIARETGTDRDTVGRYINAAKEAGLVPAESHTPSDELVHQVARRVQARSLPERSQEWSSVAAHKDRIAQWLEGKRPLRLSKI